ncbi:hypothetical protein LCGC14_0423160 [marine sediment metagenome]|uniref:Uncharacterized protein n=1 Tax=marine sediment metagenome TaxID=412755 RepID=A0A0F9VZR7_9ZZZZ
MECKHCGGIVRALYPGGMKEWITQCGNCGRYNCEKESLNQQSNNQTSDDHK